MRFFYSILAFLYLISPYDLFPDIFFGFGLLDDIVVLFFLLRYLVKFKAKSKLSLNNDDNNNDNDMPFNILGLKPSSSPNAIKLAYRKLANKYHPDKFSHRGHIYCKKAEARFIEIKEAYEKLKIMGKV